MYIFEILQYCMLHIMCMYILTTLIAPRPDHYFTVHSGAITCLERSPFFKDIILSVGGWTFAIWKEAIKVCTHITQ